MASVSCQSSTLESVTRGLFLSLAGGKLAPEQIFSDDRNPVDE